MSEEKIRSVDKATIELLDKAEKEKISTAFFRADDLKPCPIGVEESCCKICAMGPCRMPRPKKGDEKKRTGVCGATIDTVVARNFARKVAGGHGRPLGPCPRGGGDLPQGGQGRGPGLCHQGRDEAHGGGPRLRRPHGREGPEGDRHRDRREGPRRVRQAARRGGLHQEGAPQETGDMAETAASSPGASTGRWSR